MKKKKKKKKKKDVYIKYKDRQTHQLHIHLRQYKTIQVMLLQSNSVDKLLYGSKMCGIFKRLVVYNIRMTNRCIDECATINKNTPLLIFHNSNV